MTQAQNELRIAMWSGPRNVSTAFMRSWENRPDTFVCDEPFYAHYLSVRDVDHPGRDEVLAHHEPDWKKVVAQLTGPIPQGKSIYYQKHMAHHLLPEMDRDWFPLLTHCFLIRNPADMLRSLNVVLDEFTIYDTGLPQQVELFQFVQDQFGIIPPVIDSQDLLTNPREILMILCERLNIPFTEKMLSWPVGSRDSDGVWAKHWYHSVEKSTHFSAYKPKDGPLPDHLAELYQTSMTHYQQLYAHRITLN